MKKLYEQPEMEIQNFEIADVITDSDPYGASSPNDLPDQIL